METYEYSNLKKCPVEFDELAHTYTLDGKQLSGITGIIKDYLFPDMYKGVHERTLEAAAERGSAVHSQVQMIINGFPPARTDRSVEAFFDKMQGTEFIASEYLVSDLHHFASSIDIVDSRLNLYDIKTTDKLNREYLSWQLSIYAYLFELQNPTLKAGALYGCHLRDGKANVIQVERINSEIIADFLCAAADNLPWANPFVPTIDVTEEIKRAHKADLVKLAEVETAIAEIERGKAEYEAKAKELRAGLMAIMEQAGLPKLETERLKLTIVAGSDSRIIDSARLKAERPEMWNAYSKISRKSASLRITLKD